MSLLLLGAGALALLDIGVRLPLGSRRAGLALLAAFAAARAWRTGGGALLRRLPAREVALWIESRHPTLRDAWISALDLSREDDPAFSSPALVRRSLERIGEGVASVSLGGLVDWRTPARAVGRAAGILACLVALAAGWDSFRIALARLAQDRPWPQRVRLSVVCEGEGIVEVVPGRRYLLPEGEDLRVRAVRQEGSQTSDGGQIEYAFDDAWEKAGMAQQLDGTLVWTYDHLSTAIRFRVLAGDFQPPREEAVEVGVLPRPQVRDLRVHCEYPTYLGLPPADREPGQGDLEEPVGTRVSLQAETNLPVARAEAVFGGGARVALTVSPDGTHLGLDPAAAFEVAQDDTYQIEVTDANGLPNVRAVRYTIRAVRDQKPEVRMLRPARDLRVVAGATLPIEIEFADDFGLAQGAVVYRVGVESQEAVEWPQFEFEPPPEGGAPRVQQPIRRDWSLADLALQPGQVLRVVGRGRDFLPPPAGPNEGFSSEILVTVITPEEFARSISQMLEGVRAEVARMRDDQARARTQTTDLVRGEPDEAWRARTMGLVGTQHEYAERTARIAGRIAEIQELLRINHQENAERDERLRRVEGLLAREIPGRMRRAGDALAGAAGEPEGRSEALDRAVTGQDEALAGLDEILGVLSEVANFNEVILRTRRLIELWEEILRSTEGMIPGQ